MQQVQQTRAYLQSKVGLSANQRIAIIGKFPYILEKRADTLYCQ